MKIVVFRETGLEYLQANVKSVYIIKAFSALHTSSYEYISYVFLDQAICLHNMQ